MYLVDAYQGRKTPDKDPILVVNHIPVPGDALRVAHEIMHYGVPPILTQEDAFWQAGIDPTPIRFEPRSEIAIYAEVPNPWDAVERLSDLDESELLQMEQAHKRARGHVLSRWILKNSGLWISKG